MLELLKQIDTNLFLLINQANSNILDSIMYYASTTLIWIPLYLIILGQFIIKYKRIALIAVLFLILSIALADLSSVHLFKNIFQRLRPCYEPGLADVINNIVGCGGKYGFVSSHAANSFAIITMVIKLLGDKFKWLKWFMPLWGFLIIYSRIYLGKHYPTDVIVGSLLGILIGWLVFILFSKTLKYISNNADNNWASFFHPK